MLTDFLVQSAKKMSRLHTMTQNPRRRICSTSPYWYQNTPQSNMSHFVWQSLAVVIKEVLRRYCRRAVFLGHHLVLIEEIFRCSYALVLQQCRVFDVGGKYIMEWMLPCAGYTSA